MSSALVRGILKKGVSQPGNVWLSDYVAVAAQTLGDETGAHVGRDNAEVVGACEVLLLCVKPNDAVAALEALRPVLAGKLVVSIVAGLTLSTLEAAAGPGARVIRVMPNTPALVHLAASAYA